MLLYVILFYFMLFYVVLGHNLPAENLHICKILDFFLLYYSLQLHSDASGEQVRYNHMTTQEKYTQTCMW